MPEQKKFRQVGFRWVRVLISYQNKKAPPRVLFVLVRIVGLEPTREKHRNLNPTRLPIPSYPQKEKPLIFTRGGTRGGAYRWIHADILPRLNPLVNGNRTSFSSCGKQIKINCTKYYSISLDILFA